MEITHDQAIKMLELFELEYRRACKHYKDGSVDYDCWTACYYSHLGSIDMAHALGVITHDERQHYYDRVYELRPRIG